MLFPKIKILDKRERGVKHGISTSKQIMNKMRLTKWNQENSAQAYT